MTPKRATTSKPLVARPSARPEGLLRRALDRVREVFSPTVDTFEEHPRIRSFHEAQARLESLSAVMRANPHRRLPTEAELAGIVRDGE